MLHDIEVTLYRHLLAQETAPVVGSRAEAGHVFEEDTRQAIHRLLRTSEEALGRGKVFPPRYRLRIPTRSGLSYQFDGVVQVGSDHILIECKKREATQIDQVFAFAAKMADYAMAPRERRTNSSLFGLFYATSREVNDNIRQFAVAFGISLVSLELPPVSYLASCLDKTTPFARSLERLGARLSLPFEQALLSGMDRKPKELVREWRLAYHRWLQEERAFS
jgi:hypothetical protein